MLCNHPDILSRIFSLKTQETPHPTALFCTRGRVSRAWQQAFAGGANSHKKMGDPNATKRNGTDPRDRTSVHRDVTRTQCDFPEWEVQAVKKLMAQEDEAVPPLNQYRAWGKVASSPSRRK